MISTEGRRRCGGLHWLRRSLLLTGWAQLFNYIEVENSTSWEGRRNCEAEMSAARERCGKLDEMQRTYGSHVLLLRTSCSQPSSTLSGRPSSSQLCSKVERGTL